MALYIDKATVVAEIEKLRSKLSPNFIEYDYDATKVELLDNLENFLDTLEVKEVDLEKEYKNFVEDDPVYTKLVNNIVGKAIAKHFFELGLNAQIANNKIDITTE